MVNHNLRFKGLIVLFIVVFNFASATAQKEDYVWLSGYDSHVGYDSSWGFYFGTTQLDFNVAPRAITYDTLKMNFDRTNVSYCDANGNLMFYTNGVYVANSLDEKIDNSDSLNWGEIIKQDPTILQNGYRTAQGLIVLPNAGHPSQYFLLHSYLDTSAELSLYVKRILISLLDMDLNGGHGSVLYKNQFIVEDNLGGDLAACRHANGRDWWLLINKRYTNCYYRILLDPTGAHLQNGLTCSGDSIPYNTISSSTFSADGHKFAHFSIDPGVNIFDFDRCTGELSNPIYLPYPSITDSGWTSNGIAISPNNRFLYVGATVYVFQYDLLAANVAASVDTVAIYDGSRNPFGSYFHTMQLAPDGKIYEGGGNAETVYHVIDSPNSKGDSCIFLQHSIHLPSPSWGVPNFPNYRLGKLVGSPCDTLTGLSELARAEKEKTIKVFPNPATDIVTIDYGFTDWNKGEINLQITNELGQTVYEQKLPMYSGFQKINISSFSSGSYLVYIKRSGNTIATQKLMKQ